VSADYINYLLSCTQSYSADSISTAMLNNVCGFPETEASVYRFVSTSGPAKSNR